MIPSSYQQQIYREITEGSDSLVIEAVAGSGKTTTLVEATRLIPKGGLSIVLAFNKHTQEELSRRLPYTTQSHTFHSWCYAALKRQYPKPPKIDSGKCRKLLKDWVGRGDYFKYEGPVLKLMSLAKAFGYRTNSSSLSLANLAGIFNIEFDDGIVLTYTQEIFDASYEQKDVIDFDDMIYFALRDSVPFPLCDFVFVDEAQDLNSVQHELLSRMLKPNGRLVAVGDTHQAIYAFRGADSDSMNRIRERFSAKTLPLSMSYRCSQSVVREAQRALEETL